MSEVACWFTDDPIGVGLRWLSRQEGLDQAEDYARAIAQMESDFTLVVTDSRNGKLARTSNGYELVHERADGTRVEYRADAMELTIKVTEDSTTQRISYTLNQSTGQLCGRKSVKKLTAEDLHVPGVHDDSLRFPIQREDMPALFVTLGVNKDVPTLEVSSVSGMPSEGSHADSLDRAIADHKKVNPDCDPFIAQVYFTVPGEVRPTCSLAIAWVEDKEWDEVCALDLDGSADTLVLCLREFSACFGPGTISELRDVQYGVRCGMLPERLNRAMVELVRLATSHPSHAGLACLLHFLPRVRTCRAVIVPGASAIVSE